MPKTEKLCPIKLTETNLKLLKTFAEKHNRTARRELDWILTKHFNGGLKNE